MSMNSFGIGGSNAHVVMDDALHFLQQYRLVGNHRTVVTPRSRATRTQPYTKGTSCLTQHPKRRLY